MTMALKIFFLLFIIFAYSFGLRSEQFNKLGVLKSKKTKLQCQDNSSVGKGFGQKVIKPAQGTTQKTEKSLMMYTCKKCNFRNAQMVSKVAYNEGMVISTCKGCATKHLIADNQYKLGMFEYGRRTEDYLRSQGETVRKMTLSQEEINDNYLIEIDGELKTVPKSKGKPPSGATIVDLSDNEFNPKKSYNAEDFS